MMHGNHTASPVTLAGADASFCLRRSLFSNDSDCAIDGPIAQPGAGLRRSRELQRKSWDCGSGPAPESPMTRSALIDVTPSWICSVPSTRR